MFRENWDAVEMFVRMQTQWNYAGMGATVGLNYTSLDFLFKLYGKKKRRALFEQIQIIEQGALEAFRRMAENKSGD